MINGEEIAIRNPAYNAAGLIDVEIEHPDHGWIPFSCNPSDVMPYSEIIYNRALAMNPAAYVPSTPTQDDYKTAIQSHIDQAAIAKNYTDGVSCASYKDSTIPTWADEAAAFIAWRDSVWAYAFGQLADVLSGTRTPQPSIAQLLSELPSITWPD